MSDIFTIQKLQNAVVTNNSVIINKGNIVSASCVTKANYDKYLKPRFRWKYIFPIFSSAKKSYILPGDEWSKNYCHFLWEFLSKVIELKTATPDATLILPKSYLKIDFMMKCLAAFGFGSRNIKIIPKKSHLRVKNLSFIPCINIATPGYYDFLKFAEVRKTLISHYQQDLKTNFGERIYISRSDPKKNTARRVSNEIELVAMLAKYGFKTVYMEDFSFLEQLSISSFAKYVIAPHGAGITNVMFIKEGGCLLEMVNHQWGKTCFAEMCERINVDYHKFGCEPVENRGHALSNIKVDVAQLETVLRDILK